MLQLRLSALAALLCFAAAACQPTGGGIGSTAPDNTLEGPANPDAADLNDPTVTPTTSEEFDEPSGPGFDPVGRD